MLHSSKLNIVLQHTDAIRPNAEVPPLPLEKRMHEIHFQSPIYYQNDVYKTTPKPAAIAFPSQRICIHLNNQPLVTNIADSLQESERTLARDEYFLYVSASISRARTTSTNTH